MIVLRDRIFVVQQWYRFQSYTAIRRSFSNKDTAYHGKNLPSTQSIRNIDDHFRRHETVTDILKSTAANGERPVHEDDVNTVRKAYSKKQKLYQKSLLEDWFEEISGSENFAENHKENTI